MDADTSSKISRKALPESIPATGLSVVYEPETNEPIVEYNQAPQSTNPEREPAKPNSSKRLEFRQSIKAIMKGSSSKGCQDRSVADHLNDTVSAPKSGSSSVFWPGDLLPQVCEEARVLTFGYDTK
ncbi:hypothetical protein FPANT_2324, partial [Fusarium pseudoanthophilum]